MSTVQDPVDLITSPPLTSPRHHSASPEREDSDRRRQKRRRVESVEKQPSPPTNVLTPPHDHADSPQASQSSIQIPSNLSTVDLSDSDEPTIEVSKTDRDSPIIVSEAVEAAPTTISALEPLSAYTCPICFSPPTNATLTPCGHICCGQCLFTAVKSTIRRSMVIAMERAPVARCPVCRAEIPGWDGRGGGVIGLKMQLMYSL